MLYQQQEEDQFAYSPDPQATLDAALGAVVRSWLSWECDLGESRTALQLRVQANMAEQIPSRDWRGCCMTDVIMLLHMLADAVQEETGLCGDEALTY
jgi:hypothetical protein